MYMENRIDTGTDLTGKKKILYVEILRIICIVFVIFNHTNYMGYVYFLSFDNGTLPYWFYMFFTVIAGISVPIFLMISGMLLLGKMNPLVMSGKNAFPNMLLFLLCFL